MKWALDVVGSVMLGVSSAAAMDDDDIIQPSWASVQRSRGGLGGELRYSSSGVCTQTLGLLMDFAWQLQRRRAALTLFAEGEAKAHRPTGLTSWPS